MLVDGRLFRFHRFVDKHLDDFAGLGRHLAGEDLTGKAIDADPVAVLEHLAVDRHGPLGVVDIERLAADDAHLAHLPADQSGMARRSAERGQDAVSRLHATDILGAGLAANEDNSAIRIPFAMLVDPLFGFIGVELNAPRGRAGTGVNALGEQLTLRDGLAFRVWIKDRLK